MRQYKIYLDVSHSISHIGSDVRGIGVENVMEWVHSDTLFSAIIHAWAKCFGFDGKNGTKDLIEQFEEFNKEQNESILPFRVSSAFLACRESKFFGDEKSANSTNLQSSADNSSEFIEFVPRPLEISPVFKNLTKAAKINHLSWHNLLKWLGREQTNVQKDDFEQSLLEDNERYNKLFVQRIRAVNAKDRVRSQTQVYHRGEVIYEDDTFLYFFLDINYDEYWKNFETALKYLIEYAGIGGEINIGFSEIKSYELRELDTFNFKLEKQQTKKYLLSLFPLSTDIIYENSFYDIVNKKSWFHSPFNSAQYKKKTVKMFREGSCLDCINMNGKLIDVTPKIWSDQKKDNPNWHKIYRSGLGYWIEYEA